MINRWLYNFGIAVEAIINNRIRALLTSLGLIFGVASVISMLSIGKGAEQEILEQLKILGTNNIIIKPVLEQEEGKITEELEKTAEKKRFSPGLTLNDVLKISSEDIEYGGEGNEELSVKFDADVIEIGYNGLYILDIIKNIDTDEVVFLLKDSVSAAIVTPISQKANEDLMMLIMPIRLTD